MYPYRPDSDYESVNCPVCKASFGTRDKTTLFKAHCEECKATFWWYPWKDKPSATLDREKERARCGCGCGR